MKKIVFVIVLVMLSVNANAKTLFESNFQALEDGTPFIYQLARTHSRQCSGEWQDAKAIYLENGKDFMNLCWAPNEYHGWNLVVPDTGEIYDSISCLRTCKGRECKVTPEKQNTQASEACLTLEEFTQKYHY